MPYRGGSYMNEERARGWDDRERDPWTSTCGRDYDYRKGVEAYESYEYHERLREERREEEATYERMVEEKLEQQRQDYLAEPEYEQEPPYPEPDFPQEVISD